MHDLPSLPAALEQRAAATPESPFLFWPDGWNWRWWSWRQAAALTARWSAQLTGLPAGAGVAFAGDRYPEAFVLDLAVQAAGLTPVPLAGPGAIGHGGRAGPEQQAVVPAAVPPGCLAWLEVAAGEVEVTRREGEPAPGDAALGGEQGVLVAGEQGVLVAGDDGGWRPVALRELLSAVSQVESAIELPARVEGAADAAAAPPRALDVPAATAVWPSAGPGRGPRAREREILVAGWALGEWPGRLLAAWAVAAGAALVLDGDAAGRLGTVLWTRPTVFHGSAAEVAALRRQVEAARRPRQWRGWRRLPAPPLGRLRTLFQAEPPAPAEAAFWQERGARLLRLPGPGDAGRG